MKGVDLKSFRKSINFTQSQLGEYLGCGKAFISSIEGGARPLPDEMYGRLIDNPFGWDTTMLTRDIVSAKASGNATANATVNYHSASTDNNTDALLSRIAELEQLLKEEKDRTQKYWAMIEKLMNN